MSKKKSSTKGGKRSRAQRYTAEFRLSVVRLCEEENIPRTVVCEETGVATGTLSRWLQIYRNEGEEGLARVNQKKSGGQKEKTNRFKDDIVALKRENPSFGVRRISDILKRFFLIGASPETVRKTLHEEELISPPKKKPKKNITRPRFFERSTPNQMWQTDIFTFRLGGRNAYLLGYIDDYSRFIIGMEVYRSQTAENLLEVYRRAISEYNPPKEMLTDNGRQYVNWRGTTRFEKELKKEKVKHFRSQPHHPMTLGKIERFWKTIYAEFLSRTQFESFENARERLAHWIRYYNYLRPHQGIKGLCPADRYFEVASELRKTLAQGVKENELELALRGEKQSPFYMVGRMEGQSVVVRAEKGKLKMIVDEGVSGDPEKRRELTYDLGVKKGAQDGRRKERKTCEQSGDFCTETVSGSTGSMVGEDDSLGSVSGAEHQVGGAGWLAEAGNQSDAGGIGAGQEIFPQEELRGRALSKACKTSGENSCPEASHKSTIRGEDGRITVRDKRRILLE